MSKLGSWSSLCFPKLPKPECQVFSPCSENPLEVSTCPLHCVPGAQTPQKGHLSHLQLLLKLSFKGKQPPNMVQVDNPGTLPLGLSTGNLASALGSRRGLGRSDRPSRTFKPQGKKNPVNVFRWDCAFFFLLNHTGKCGLLQWEEQIVCALPLQGGCREYWRKPLN